MDWISKLKHLNMGSLTDILPSSGIECVSWVELMKQATGIIKLSTDGAALRLIKMRFAEQLPPEFTLDLDDESRVQAFEQLDHDSRRFWGEKILQIYFESILKGPYLQLDMRPGNLKILNSSPEKTSQPEASWVSSRFYFSVEPSFSKNMNLLYRGYYLNRPKDFKQALIELGLLGTEEDATELEAILYDYFRAATDKPIRFDTEMFKNGFFSLFKYLKKHRRKISSQFIWTGIALAGVYETLEALGSEYAVREVFLKCEGLLGDQT